MTTIAEIIDRSIAKEGRYSDHPADKGGPTMWGITQRVARRNGWGGSMRALPRAGAVAIYTREYVLAPNFDAVHKRNDRIAEELIDTGINMGPDVASRWLQEALNALNNGGKLYADVTEDADVGPETLTALEAYLKTRGPEAEVVMLRALNGLQTARYIELARKRTANEAFVFGWLRTRVGL